MARPPCWRVLLLVLFGAVCLGVSLGAHHVKRRQAAPRGAEVSTDCLRCICRARGCNWKQGCRNDVCGGFEITKEYFNHSNLTEEVSIYKERTYKSCTTDFQCAITVVRLYMKTLATDCDQDGTIDCDDIMMTHYYGIEGCIGAQEWVSFTNDWKLYRACRKDINGTN